MEECLEENDGVKNQKGKLEASSGNFELEHIEVWADLEDNVGKVIVDRMVSQLCHCTRKLQMTRSRSPAFIPYNKVNKSDFV